jgi:hypothetical protein
MPGLVPGIHPTANTGASGKMDSGDKRRNDTVQLIVAQQEASPEKGLS